MEIFNGPAFVSLLGKTEVWGEVFFVPDSDFVIVHVPQTTRYPAHRAIYNKQAIFSIHPCSQERLDEYLSNDNNVWKYKSPIIRPHVCPNCDSEHCEGRNGGFCDGVPF